MVILDFKWSAMQLKTDLKSTHILHWQSWIYFFCGGVGMGGGSIGLEGDGGVGGEG